jgi:NADH:ubiquinone oxidoreductase subunit K
MIIGQELLSVGLNIFLISAGITISDANILSATLFLWIIGAVDVAVGLPLVMAITISKRLGANKLSCVNNLRAVYT